MDACAGTVSISIVAITKDNPCDSKEAESQGFRLRIMFLFKIFVRKKTENLSFQTDK